MADDSRIQNVKTPYLTVQEGTAPDNPDATTQRLFVDSADHALKMKDSSGTVTAVGSGGTDPNHAYYIYPAALLEPLAIEPLQRGAFTYTVAAGATKIALNAWFTRLGASGRWEVRDPRFPVPLRDLTVTGLDASSVGVFINPALPTYTDARDTYFDRLQAIYETAALYLPVTAPSTSYMFLPGPYGSIITSVNVFDLTWLIARPYGTSLGWNLSNEIGDTGSTDFIRFAHGSAFSVSKNVVNKIVSGAERSGGVGRGAITYFNCPSTWGKVVDSNSYDFRDDFMGASLDTATKWTRTQSSAGNMEIQTVAGVANWLKVLGNSSWGANTITSKTSVVRAAGKVLQMDVVAADSSAMYGWWDGAGTSYTDLAHCISFAGASEIHVYEAGTDRGNVGSYAVGSIYRIRLTLNSTGANTCKYEIQGGSEHPPIGGASWDNITPGTTSNSTTPLYAGIVGYSGPAYVSDVRIY